MQPWLKFCHVYTCKKVKSGINLEYQAKKSCRIRAIEKIQMRATRNDRGHVYDRTNLPASKDYGQGEFFSDPAPPPWGWCLWGPIVLLLLSSPSHGTTSQTQ